MNLFETILLRLKHALNTNKDAHIAKLIGMTAPAFNFRKKQNSVPFAEFINLANSKNISLNWLFRGEGVIFLNENLKKEVKELRNKITLLDKEEIKALTFLVERILKNEKKK